MDGHGTTLAIGDGAGDWADTPTPASRTVAPRVSTPMMTDGRSLMVALPMRTAWAGGYVSLPW